MSNLKGVPFEDTDDIHAIVMRFELMLREAKALNSNADKTIESNAKLKKSMDKQYLLMMSQDNAPSRYPSLRRAKNFILCAVLGAFISFPMYQIFIISPVKNNNAVLRSQEGFSKTLTVDMIDALEDFRVIRDDESLLETIKFFNKNRTARISGGDFVATDDDFKIDYRPTAYAIMPNIK